MTDPDITFDDLDPGPPPSRGLLEACVEILGDLETYQTQDTNHLTVELVSEHFARLRAAIAKATGETP